MRLRRRPMTLRDAQPCAELIASHPLESKRYGKLAEHLPSAWKQCLRNGSLISAVLEDMESGKPSLQAFGVSGVVTDVLRLGNALHAMDRSSACATPDAQRFAGLGSHRNP